jgi:hypothetical protein
MRNKRGIARLLKNRKGEEPSEEVSVHVIFIVLNLVFFVALLYFVSRASSGATILEERYAKQVALMLDAAKPGMIIHFDFGKDLEIAKKNGVTLENILRIDNDKKEVIVKFTSKGGFKYSYFSNINVQKEVKPNQNRVILTIT